MAAILPKDLARNSMILGQFSSADSIFIRSRINSSLSIVLGSLYMDQTQNISSDIFDRVARFTDKEKLPLVLGVDSNAHHTAWGHPTTNNRGQQLLQVLNANNLIICNTGTSPTFVGSRGSSCIDLTICNLAGINLIQNWRVNQGKSLSDHEAICYSLDLGNRTSFASRSPAKCDWQLYETLVSASFDMSPYWFKPVVTAADLQHPSALLRASLSSDKRHTQINCTLVEC